MLVTENKKNYYIERVARESGIEYEDAKADMELARTKYGITFRDYCVIGIHNLPPHERKKEARTIVINKRKRLQRIIDIKQETGMSAKTIFRNIESLNKKDIINVSLVLYEKYKMFEKNEEQNIELMEAIAARNELVKVLRRKTRLLDNGKMSYKNFAKALTPVYDMTSQILTDEYKQQLIDRFIDIIPEKMKDEETMEHIAVDMEVTRLVLRFGYSEYMIFKFFDKSLKVRRSFLSATERRKVLSEKNDPEAALILNNKYKCYDLMKDYYGREAMLVNDSGSFLEFKEFIKRHRKFVVKPTELSFGKGIIKVKAPLLGIGLKKKFAALLESYGEFMVEELILQHEKTRVLNQDSVNTIRIPTYFNGEKTIVQRPFMKIGRAGSFVDNGGSGGILVAVDYETGKLIGNGIDEGYNTYKTHPDSNIKFDGYQLPNWEEARKLADEISNKIENVSFVGWDFACTDKGQWIVVEGNSMTQFIGQQATLDKGMREEFLKEVR